MLILVCTLWNEKDWLSKTQCRQYSSYKKYLQALTHIYECFTCSSAYSTTYAFVLMRYVNSIFYVTFKASYKFQWITSNVSSDTHGQHLRKNNGRNQRNYIILHSDELHARCYLIEVFRRDASGQNVLNTRLPIPEDGIEKVNRNTVNTYRTKELFTTKTERCLASHNNDVIMTTMASKITSLTVVYSTFYSDADQRKHQSSASLAFVWGILRDRWIPRTNGQLRGKCFHLMTSSCKEYVSMYQPRTHSNSRPNHKIFLTRGQQCIWFDTQLRSPDVNVLPRDTLSILNCIVSRDLNVTVNILRSWQNGRHLPDEIFKCIFSNEHVWISIKISPRFAPKGPTDNIPSLVQILVWRRPGDMPLSESVVVNLLTQLALNELRVW